MKRLKNALNFVVLISLIFFLSCSPQKYQFDLGEIAVDFIRDDGNSTILRVTNLTERHIKSCILTCKLYSNKLYSEDFYLKKEIDRQVIYPSRGGLKSKESLIVTIYLPSYPYLSFKMNRIEYY